MEYPDAQVVWGSVVCFSHSQETGDVCSKGKKHNERGYAGMILHHIVDQKMPMSKSERQPFASSIESARQNPDEFQFLLMSWKENDKKI